MEDIHKKDVRDAFFDKIYELATIDENLVFITADAGAFGLKRFKEDYPERFINVGVAEQAMVLLATGLAMTGKNVFIYSIIPFITQRCLEHIKVNIASMNLPITIVGCGSGLSFGFDGPTHHGIQDIAAMRSISNIRIFSPCDAASSMIAAELSYESKKPAYVRLDKGIKQKIYEIKNINKTGIKEVYKSSKNIIISTGEMTQIAKKVCDNIQKENELGLIDLTILNPIDEKLLYSLVKDASNIFVIEEHSKIGGVNSIISNFLSSNQIKANLYCHSLPDSQIFQYGSREWLLDNLGLSAKKLTIEINQKLKKDYKDE
jgi:transketolase